MIGDAGFMLVGRMENIAQYQGHCWPPLHPFGAGNVLGANLPLNRQLPVRFGQLQAELTQLLGQPVDAHSHQLVPGLAHALGSPCGHGAACPLLEFDALGLRSASPGSSARIWSYHFTGRPFAAIVVHCREGGPASAGHE